MVTLTDLAQQEQELNQSEAQARQVANKPVPKRGFGTGITKQDQQQVIQEKANAQQVLQEIAQRRQDINQARNQINQAEASRQAQSQSRYGNYETISSFANSGIPLNILKAKRKEYGLSQNDISSIEEVRAGQLNIQKAKDQQAKFQQEGLVPVTDSSGKIIGFSDLNNNRSISLQNIPRIAASDATEYNRFARAGIIEANQSMTENRPQLTQDVKTYQEPTNQEAFSRTPQEQTFREKIREKLTDVVKGKDIILEQNVQNQVRSEGYIPGTPEYEHEVAVKTAQAYTAQTIIFAAAGSLAGVPELPTVLKVPIRPLEQEGLFFEVQKGVLLNGEVKTLSAYEIFKEISPPKIVLDSREVGGFLGNEITVEPAKYQTTATVMPVIEKGKVITLTTKTGKTFMLETLTGDSLKINLNQIDQLTKTEKFLFQQLAESKTGRPVSIENIPKIFNKEQDFTLGVIEKVREGVGPKVRGKSITRFETLSISKIIQETEEFEIIQTKVLFKDVTKDLAAARGKTPSLKGFIKVFKEPIILDEASSVETGFKPSLPKGKTKTPLSLTFKKTEVLEIMKPAPEVIETPTKALNKVRTSKINGVPDLLHGGLDRVSVNRPADVSSNAFVRGFKDLAYNKVASGEKGSTKTINLNLPTYSSKSIQLNKEITKLLAKEVAKEIVKVASIEIAREVQRQVPRQIPRQIAKQVSKTLPKSSKPIISVRPKGSTSSKGIVVALPNIKKPKSLNVETGFKVFYFSKGKKIYLPGITSKREAIIKGEITTLKTLSARFGIQKTNIKVKSQSVNTKDLFRRFFREFKIRKGKAIRTPNVFIQKRGTRLSTSEEINAIQRSLKLSKMRVR